MVRLKFCFLVFIVSATIAIVSLAAEAKIIEKPDVTFGEFKVPRLHENPDGEQLELRFAKIERKGGDDRTPIFYFSGGPGEAATRIVKRYVEKGRFNALFQTLI